MNKYAAITPSEGLITKRYVTPNRYHSHTGWEIVVFLDGISTNGVNGINFEASKGDFFLLGPSHSHEIAFIKTPHLHQDVYYSQEEVLEAIGELPKQMISDIITGKRLIHLKLSLNALSTVQSYLDTLQSLSTFESDMERREMVSYGKYISLSLLKFLVGYYIINCYRAKSTTPKWLVEFVLELQKPEVFSRRINDIISLTNYSHSQVGAKFKEYKGVSLVDYLIEIRTTYAKDLLETTNESVLTISEECGYSSLSSFIKLFREKTGCSPLQYRKKIIKERKDSNTGLNINL